MKLVERSDLYHLAVLLVMFLAAVLPPRLRNLLAQLIGHLIYGVSRAIGRTAYRSSRLGLQTALGGSLSASESRKVLRRSFVSFWDDTLDSVPSPYLGFQSHRIRIEGEDYLKAALERAKGVILWESRVFGKRILAKQLLALRGYRIHQVHDSNHMGGFRNRGVGGTWVRQHIVNRTLEWLSLHYLTSIIHIPDTGSLSYLRRLQALIRSNEIICSAADGDLGQGWLETTFLSQPYRLQTGMLSLARTTKAAVLPLLSEQAADGQWQILIGPPLRFSESATRQDVLQSGVRQFLDTFEPLVRRCPQLYRNWGSFAGDWINPEKTSSRASV